MTAARTIALLAALLVLWAAAALAQNDQIQRQTIAPNTEEEYPRNGEGDLIELKDGRLLLAWTRFLEGSSDFDRAEIATVTSTDRGQTWSEPTVIQETYEGEVNVMDVSLLRLANGEILLAYARKDTMETCAVYVRWSGDEGQSWSEEVRATNFPGYIPTNNDRLVQLKSGRILLPVYGGWPGTIYSLCVYSDDNGRTWQRGADVWIGHTGYGADEPAIIELEDGRIMMIIRTVLERIYKCYSSDQGETWTTPKYTTLVSPNGPASIARIPSTGDLLVIYNSSRTQRTPLNSALSHDEGDTWENIRTLENEQGSFCYTSIDFVDDHALLTYYAPGGLRLTSVPVSWFYEPAPLLTWSRDGPVSGAPGEWHIVDNGSVCIKGPSGLWRGELDSEVIAALRVTSTLEGKTATTMIWIGSNQPADSCALYLRRGPEGDQISLDHEFTTSYDLPDAGEFHTYRITTNHAEKTVAVYVDEAPDPALTGNLCPLLGMYNVNRILVGDPNVNLLGGDSQWRELRWKNGAEGEWFSASD